MHSPSSPLMESAAFVHPNASAASSNRFRCKTKNNNGEGCPSETWVFIGDDKSAESYRKDVKSSKSSSSCSSSEDMIGGECHATPQPNQLLCQIAIPSLLTNQETMALPKASACHPLQHIHLQHRYLTRLNCSLLLLKCIADRQGTTPDCFDPAVCGVLISRGPSLPITFSLSRRKPNDY